MQRFGDAVPVFGALLKPKPHGDRGKPLAAGPAHRRRMGMDALTAAIFPDASIRQKRLFGGAMPERFQQMKQTLVAGARQPAVKEHRHGRENDTAIGVVLHLIDGGVADPHRAVAEIPRSAGRVFYASMDVRHR